MHIEENVPLKDFTTFRTGGPAKYFCRVKSIDDLIEAVNFSRKKNLGIFVLGDGSNVLAGDTGFPGLVIKVEIGGREFYERGGKQGGRVAAIAGAGENWDDFVGETVERNLSGLENLSLIPGTAGAAPIQNINAYGREVKGVIDWVETFNTKEMRLQTFYNTECEFAYRKSFFQTPEGKNFIVTRVAFSLSPNGIPSIEYKDIKEELARWKIIIPTIQDVREATVAVRTAKLPNVKQVGTAGSFFKHPIVPTEQAEALKKIYPDMPMYPMNGSGGDGKTKLLAGWIMDHICNMKGERKGNVGAWERQALVVVNYGGATSEEIISYAEDLRARVKEKTSIELEYEVQRMS